MTGSGFAIAEPIVFILMLFCPRSVIFCRSDRPRPIEAGLKTVRTNPLRNTTRKRATKPCLFCQPHPSSDFRLAPGSFNDERSNLGYRTIVRPIAQRTLRCFAFFAPHPKRFDFKSYSNYR